MRFLRKEEKDISIVMPCLNEAATVGICVDNALKFISSNGLNGEIIVVDNGSTDCSASLAIKHGALVVCENRKGYGSAIRRGLRYSSGRIIVIGDCDTTYDFLALDDFYYGIIKEGYDMVIGDRFAKEMENGAMPFSHKLGVRFLSLCGRIAFNTNVHDFHCGLRSISRAALSKMDYGTCGMEFATEMIACASKAGLRIKQIPTRLSVCRYVRKSKLRTVRDGLRHLGYIVHNTNK